MEPNRANELLLTTLAERDSRVRTARLKLGRLIALFAGIAAVLLLASNQPAKASGASSLLPDGAGLSITLPLGDFPGASGRPMVQLVALVGDQQVELDRARPISPRRIAFAPVATIGGLAGVAVWPSDRLSTPNGSRNGAGMAPARRSETAPGTRTMLAGPSVRKARADRVGVDSIQVHRKARLATATYQRLLHRYLSLRPGEPGATAVAHARLVRAYEIARAWRKYAGLR